MSHRTYAPNVQVHTYTIDTEVEVQALETPTNVQTAEGPRRGKNTGFVWLCSLESSGERDAKRQLLSKYGEVTSSPVRKGNAVTCVGKLEGEPRKKV